MSCIDRNTQFGIQDGFQVPGYLPFLFSGGAGPEELDPTSSGFLAPSDLQPSGDPAADLSSTLVRVERANGETFHFEAAYNHANDPYWTITKEPLVSTREGYGLPVALTANPLVYEPNDAAGRGTVYAIATGGFQDKPEYQPVRYNDIYFRPLLADKGTPVQGTDYHAISELDIAATPNSGDWVWRDPETGVWYFSGRMQDDLVSLLTLFRDFLLKGPIIGLVSWFTDDNRTKADYTKDDELRRMPVVLKDTVDENLKIATFYLPPEGWTLENVMEAFRWHTGVVDATAEQTFQLGLVNMDDLKWLDTLNDHGYPVLSAPIILSGEGRLTQGAWPDLANDYVLELTAVDGSKIHILAEHMETLGWPAHTELAWLPKKLVVVGGPKSPDNVALVYSQDSVFSTDAGYRWEVFGKIEDPNFPSPTGYPDVAYAGDLHPAQGARWEDATAGVDYERVDVGKPIAWRDASDAKWYLHRTGLEGPQFWDDSHMRTLEVQFTFLADNLPAGAAEVQRADTGEPLGIAYPGEEKYLSILDDTGAPTRGVRVTMY